MIEFKKRNYIMFFFFCFNKYEVLFILLVLFDYGIFFQGIRFEYGKYIGVIY